MQFFDPKLPDLFRNTASDEWTFTNDATGGDLRIMRFENSPYKKLSEQDGFSSLPEFVQKKLQKSQTYSLSEVTGWRRIEFENQRLIDMFGSDAIYVPPEDMDAAFFKALEQWFETLPYGSDEQGFAEGGDSFELDDTKSYGLTSSLMSIFGDG
jgi:hypothetical protein